MRLCSLQADMLLEATPAQIVKRKGMELEEFWRDVYSDDMSAEDIVKYLSRLAPKGKENTYIEWMAKIMLAWDQSFDPYANGQKIRYALQAHANNPDSGQRDIMRYRTYADFERSFSTYAKDTERDYAEKRDEKFLRRTGIGPKDSGAEAEEWIKNKLYKINSVRASRVLGPDTWCTSNRRQSEDYCSRNIDLYTNDGQDPYFIISTNDFRNSQKIGFFPGSNTTNSFQDANNSPLTSEEIKTLWGNNPDIYSMVSQYIRHDRHKR